jgi:cyclopropane-fatty-acyl-phospholipid synthase
MASREEQLVRDLCARIGIEVNGPKATDLQIKDSRFYRRVLAEGSLGLGESYMDGWWDVGDLLAMNALIAAGKVEKEVKQSWPMLFHAFKARYFNLQTRGQAAVPATDHYDVTIEAYRSMTDSWHALSCGYWKNAGNLQESSEAKLELICRKIGLKASDRVLDIGCGLGSFTRYAAEKYGCRVVAINISSGHVEIVKQLTAGLPVTVHCCDYRDTGVFLKDGPFDKAVSVEMFEHVGYRNHRRYMEVVQGALKEGGVFCLQTAGNNGNVFQNDPWFQKYIFPNAVVPSVEQIGQAIADLLVLEDWHNFGPDYVKTCYAWFEQFDRNWQGSKEDRFYRMWKYWILAVGGGFKVRTRQMWQLVLSKGGVQGGYEAVR